MGKETESMREDLEKLLKWGKSDEVQQAIAKVNTVILQIAKTYSEQQEINRQQMARDMTRKR